jgi:hypothetical protein
MQEWWAFVKEWWGWQVWLSIGSMFFALIFLNYVYKTREKERKNKLEQQSKPTENKEVK